MARPVCDNRIVRGLKSLRGGGALSSDVSIELVNDQSAPGSNRYYGTNEDGDKGWFPLLGSDEIDVASLLSLINNLQTRIEILEDQISGCCEENVVITGADYTVESGDVLVKATAAGITITLPDPTSPTQEGREISVKNLSGGDITVASSGVIDSQTSWTLADTDGMTVRCDGGIWVVI